jgi:hypothetical protein
MIVWTFLAFRCRELVGYPWSVDVRLASRQFSWTPKLPKTVKLTLYCLCSLQFLQESTSSDGVDIWGLFVIQQLTILPNKKILGKVFRKDQKILSESLQVTISHLSFLVIALKRFHRDCPTSVFWYAFKVLFIDGLCIEFLIYSKLTLWGTPGKFIFHQGSC